MISKDIEKMVTSENELPLKAIVSALKRETNQSMNKRRAMIAEETHWYHLGREGFHSSSNNGWVTTISVLREQTKLHSRQLKVRQLNSVLSLCPQDGVLSFQLMHH